MPLWARLRSHSDSNPEPKHPAIQQSPVHTGLCFEHTRPMRCLITCIVLLFSQPLTAQESTVKQSTYTLHASVSYSRFPGISSSAFGDGQIRLGISPAKGFLFGPIATVTLFDDDQSETGFARGAGLFLRTEQRRFFIDLSGCWFRFFSTDVTDGILGRVSLGTKRMIRGRWMIEPQFFFQLDRVFESSNTATTLRPGITVGFRKEH